MSNAQQTTNKLCLGCQQFFGNPANDNLCSSCFKKRMHAGSQNPSSVQTQPRTQMPEAVSQFLGTSEKPAVVERIVEEPQPMIIEPIEQKPEDNKPKQDDHSRCWSCKKKVNLLGVKCKCEFTFCNKHRMPEDHTCEFDHAFFGREQIKQNNPLVQKAKLEKI